MEVGDTLPLAEGEKDSRLVSDPEDVALFEGDPLTTADAEAMAVIENESL